MKVLHIIILFSFIISCNSVELTKERQVLKENAIAISNLSKLNTKIYDEISEFDIIMVGEMHGTKEPAEFAYGLCDLISQHEENVILALEIHPGEMYGLSARMSIDQLKNLEFFYKENKNGANSRAWLDLINRSNQNKSINIEFIDGIKFTTRDSTMYMAIRELRKTYPNTKIVTLSGMVHNMLTPHRDELKMGGYLFNDTINFDPKKIMSINHVYTEGTMFNNINNVLKIRTIERSDNIFNQTISSNMFFCQSVFEDYDKYTHFLYTEKVSHSEAVK